MVHQEKKLTGWHVLAILLSAFFVIILANTALIMNAVKTFPGLEAKNSYVASQEFDAKREAQEALGWASKVEYTGEEIVLSIKDADGDPVFPSEISLMIGRPTTDKMDQELALTYNGLTFSAPLELASGDWAVFIKAKSAEGVDFQQQSEFYVK